MIASFPGAFYQPPDAHTQWHGLCVSAIIAVIAGDSYALQKSQLVCKT